MISFGTAVFNRTSSASSSAGAASATPVADKALGALLQAQPLLQSLAAQTMSAVPANALVVAGTLWGLIDSNNNSTINKADVQQALAAVGINGTDSVDALWAQINPTNSTTVDARQFGANRYLANFIKSKLPSVLASVEKARLQSGGGTPTSGSLFDYLQPSHGSGTIVDSFA